MYSLLCRHARINAFNQGHEDDGGVPEGSKFAPLAAGAVGPGGPGRSRALERSRPLQKALLAVVLLGTAFMFCDGVLSPAASGGALLVPHIPLPAPVIWLLQWE